MGVEIGDRQFSCGRGIGESEPGQQALHPAVPCHAADADLMGDDGGAERLGDGSELEDGVGVHGSGFAHPAEAVAAGEAQTLTLHDGQCDPRNARACLQALRQRIGGGDGVGRAGRDPAGRRPGRSPRRGRQERRQTAGGGR